MKIRAPASTAGARPTPNNPNYPQTLTRSQDSRDELRIPLHLTLVIGVEDVKFVILPPRVMPPGRSGRLTGRSGLSPTLSPDGRTQAAKPSP